MNPQSSNITNSKLCNYGCNTLIYWNSGKKAFVEVETGNKHFCKSRNPNTTTNQVSKLAPTTTTNTNRPTFTTGSGKPFIQSQQQQRTYNNAAYLSTKQQHSNSIQVLKGTEQEVTRQYERLSDIVTNLGGKIHGSQSHYLNNSELRIIVYYEVSSSENRELVKARFKI